MRKFLPKKREKNKKRIKMKWPLKFCLAAPKKAVSEHQMAFMASRSGNGFFHAHQCTGL